MSYVTAPSPVRSLTVIGTKMTPGVAVTLGKDTVAVPEPDVVDGGAPETSPLTTATVVGKPPHGPGGGRLVPIVPPAPMPRMY